MRALAVSTEFAGSQIVLTSASDTIYNMVLSANTEDHVTIPAKATKVIIKSTNVVYVKVGPSGTTAAIPSTDVTDGTGSAINPPGYILGISDTTISCKSPGACKVSLEFFL